MWPLFFAIACTDPIEAPAVKTGCNGLDHLCDRRVSEVTFARTHNSHASEERGYLSVSMNHYPAVPTQLEDGIRALNFDVYFFEESMVVCHGFCEFGSQPFAEILDEVGAFMSSNPREVLLVDLQNETSLERTTTAIEDNVVNKWLYSHSIDEPWPALQALIDADTRLIVFTDDDGEKATWMHDTDALVYSTGWGAKEPEDLNCDLAGEGIAFDNGLFELDHTLTNPLASPDLADQVNHNPYLIDRALECAEIIGKNPNIVSVDYYTIGDVLEAVELLNAE